MVGVDGSSPFAPTNFREGQGKNEYPNLDDGTDAVSSLNLFSFDEKVRFGRTFFLHRA